MNESPGNQSYNPFSGLENTWLLENHNFGVFKKIWKQKLFLPFVWEEIFPVNFFTTPLYFKVLFPFEGFLLLFFFFLTDFWLGKLPKLMKTICKFLMGWHSQNKGGEIRNPVTFLVKQAIRLLAMTTSDQFVVVAMI